MTHLRNLIAIVLVAVALAGLYNTFSGRGIPWVAQEVKVEGAATPRLVLSSAALAINYIELEEARSKFDHGILFVDAREPEEYRPGHVKGAVNISAKKEPDVIKSALSRQKKDQEIVIYCDGEECGASTMLAGKLQRLGFTKVHVFFGGWTAWKNAGLPVEKG
ncbi:MAG: rhodanese-like domain-containing protein [Acidobacteria bacterium]|nr:MAG: rhodanese-like domain-containing protein [Acidobacteriota bacterium]